VFFEKTPTQLLKIIYSHKQQIDAKLAALRKFVQNIFDGVRKNELSEWWLTFIEETVNEYLKGVGYDGSVIPDDYISNPPTNIGIVKANLDLIRKAMNDTSAEFCSFLEKTTHSVYVELHAFVKEIESVLHFDWNRMPFNFNINEHAIARLRRDLDYLYQMRVMDMNFINKMRQGRFESVGIQMCDVVPGYSQFFY
jgi:hypothetical protein